MTHRFVVYDVTYNFLSLLAFSSSAALEYKKTILTGSVLEQRHISINLCEKSEETRKQRNGKVNIGKQDKQIVNRGEREEINWTELRR